jgi:hypothetical protein
VRPAGRGDQQRLSGEAPEVVKDEFVDPPCGRAAGKLLSKYVPGDRRLNSGVYRIDSGTAVAIDIGLAGAQPVPWAGTLTVQHSRRSILRNGFVCLRDCILGSPRNATYCLEAELVPKGQSNRIGALLDLTLSTQRILRPNLAEVATHGSC